MKLDKLLDLVTTALDDLKASNVVTIDVRNKIDITDLMIIASGTSDRHLQALADQVVQEVKKAGVKVGGVEKDNAWVLIDLYDIVIHIMLPETRDFYGLEKLWQFEIQADSSQPASV
jgi:ribosome-associated protein